MLRMLYFSGTGNARAAAHWMGAAWRERGRAAEVADLTQVDPRALHLDPGDELGLASPTHGFNLPPTTLRFLRGLPRAPHANRAFVLNTRAGVRVFGLPLPGLSGVAQLLAALILLAKGYRVVGMRPIDLPSNWISLHPGLRPDTVRALYARCETITRRFAHRLLDGGRDLRALWDLPQDLLVAPLALGYFFVGRFWFAKSFVASSACDGCGACVQQCPTRALELVAGRPFWTVHCESCMRCMNHCPRRAIETAHGFALGLPLLLSLLLATLAYPALQPHAPALLGTGLLATALRALLGSALLLGLLVPAYSLLHRALRLRWIERLVVATSLTHFHFWRRYRPPRPR